MTCPPRGLYAILDGSLVASARLVPAAAAAIAGGAVMLQYRDKNATGATRRERAAAVLAGVRGTGVPVLINDDPDLAEAVGAHGVHVGQHDTSARRARAKLGPDAIVGVSCHGKLDNARRAVEAGADYVSLGRFFASGTKPQAPPASLDVLGGARDLGCPVVAIGGVNADNGHALIAAGADLLAVAGGVFGGGEPQRRAATLSRLFA